MFNHYVHSNLKICNPKTSFKGKLPFKLLSLNEEHLILNVTKFVIQNKELFVSCLMCYWKVWGSSSLYNHYKSHTELCYISKYLQVIFWGVNVQNWQKQSIRGRKGHRVNVGSELESLESRAREKSLFIWGGDLGDGSVGQGWTKQGKRESQRLFKMVCLCSLAEQYCGQLCLILGGSSEELHGLHHRIYPLFHQGQKIADIIDSLSALPRKEVSSEELIALHIDCTYMITSGPISKILYHRVGEALGQKARQMLYGWGEMLSGYTYTELLAAAMAGVKHG